MAVEPDMCFFYGAEVLPGFSASKSYQAKAADGSDLTVLTSAQRCPIGSYNPGYTASTSCIPCPTGTTTQAAASTQLSSCSRSLQAGNLAAVHFRRSCGYLAKAHPDWLRYAVFAQHADAYVRSHAIRAASAHLQVNTARLKVWRAH